MLLRRGAILICAVDAPFAVCRYLQFVTVNKSPSDSSLALQLAICSTLASQWQSVHYVYFDTMFRLPLFRPVTSWRPATSATKLHQLNFFDSRSWLMSVNHCRLRSTAQCERHQRSLAGADNFCGKTLHLFWLGQPTAGRMLNLRQDCRQTPLPCVKWRETQLNR